jgi:aryl-alcohol dehydrogenase-like predicted oxidoreductase
MHSRTFNQSNHLVSEVGMGCWQLGGDWGNVGEDEALAILHGAADAGVTFFDTADVYGGGRSETLIGRFLQETSAEVFVATKLGRFGDPGGSANYTPQAMRAHTEESLQRLGVPALDLTQLHCIPTEELRRGEVFDTLRGLQAEGKIRQFGASVETMEEAQICLEQEGLASLQIIFNLFRQKPTSELLEQAQHQGVAIIVRLPLASGLLSGKMRHDTQFPLNDHRNYNRDGAAFNVGETFAGLPFEKGVELADALKPLVPEGLTMAQMALRWLLDFDAVTTIIPGAKTPEMARANAAVSDLFPLAADLHSRLTTFYRDQVAAFIRGPY